MSSSRPANFWSCYPQIVDACEKLQKQDNSDSDGTHKSTASVMVPLAYSFPHLGKILIFVFVTFAAWYSGRGLSTGQTASMATSGTLSSFASPLVSLPYLLDQYELSQDLMAFFILPGFLTMRLGDAVGVVHLMALSLIVDEALRGRLQVHWKRLLAGTLGLMVCLGMLGMTSRWYLASTTLDYDLDQRLLGLGNTYSLFKGDSLSPRREYSATAH